MRMEVEWGIGCRCLHIRLEGERKRGVLGQASFFFGFFCGTRACAAGARGRRFRAPAPAPLPLTRWGSRRARGMGREGLWSYFGIQVPAGHSLDG